MMKRRIFAALLAGAMILSLAACGGKAGGGSDASNPGASSSHDGSQPDASTGDGADITLILNRTEITLNSAGATFQLKYTVDPDIYDGLAVYTSSDESVATVDLTGCITAVSPGKAVITATYDSAVATCAVTCDWEEETKPAGDTSKPEIAPPDTAVKVDLAAFYETITGQYEFGMLELADDGIMDMLYSGLTAVSTEQCLVYYCPMTMNNGEFALIQVKDSKDVDAVKKVLQDRIDYMVGDGNGPGGAQYPMAMDSWENNSRIVVNGSYVMMVVNENCDDIVKEFNELTGQYRALS